KIIYSDIVGKSRNKITKMIKHSIKYYMSDDEIIDTIIKVFKDTSDIETFYLFSLAYAISEFSSYISIDDDNEIYYFEGDLKGYLETVKLDKTYHRKDIWKYIYHY